MSTIFDVPDDCLKEIMGHMSISDMVNFIMTCKHFLNRLCGHVKSEHAKKTSKLYDTLDIRNVTNGKSSQQLTQLLLENSINIDLLQELAERNEWNCECSIDELFHHIISRGLYAQIQDIRNPSLEVQLAAVKQNGRSIEYIKNPSLEVQLEAVKQNGRSIEYIKNPSLEVQLEAVKKNGHSIEYIKNPSLEVQLAAVKENGRSIKYIKNPSFEVQLAAVKENGYAIEHIKNPSLEIQLAAVKENGCSIEYIKNPSLEIQREAVKRSLLCISYIDSLCPEVQFEILNQNIELCVHIKKPDDKVLLHLYSKLNSGNAIIISYLCKHRKKLSKLI